MSLDILLFQIASTKKHSMSEFIKAYHHGDDLSLYSND